jgi:hypothetical protein
MGLGSPRKAVARSTKTFCIAFNDCPGINATGFNARDSFKADTKAAPAAETATVDAPKDETRSGADGIGTNETGAAATEGDSKGESNFAGDKAD